MSKMPIDIAACRSNPRKRAWQNIMVAAINAGLEQRVFGLADGENFGMAYDGRMALPCNPNYGTAAQYQFSHADLRFDARVADAACNELRFSVTLASPTSTRNYINSAWAGVRLDDGFDAVARGWFLRQDKPDVDPATLNGNRPISISRLQKVGSFQCRDRFIRRIATTPTTPRADYILSAIYDLPGAS